jgi:aconitate hydratase
MTQEYLISQGRAQDYQPLESDPDAVYEQIVNIDLNQLETHCLTTAYGG